MQVDGLLIQIYLAIHQIIIITATNFFHQVSCSIHYLAKIQEGFGFILIRPPAVEI